MASRTQPATVFITLLSGERAELEIANGHTAKDLISALIQSGKLPGQDSQGAPLQYELLDERLMTALPGDRPLLECGVTAGTELRVKPGARVGSFAR